MTSNVTRTEADAVAEIAERAASTEDIALPKPDSADNRIIAVPKGIELRSIKKLIDEYRTEPERKEGTARFQDLDSFIGHTNRFKDADSALFADASSSAPSLTCVLDYHCRADGKPRFGTHRGVYTFPISEEWSTWCTMRNKEFTQSAFAEHIENRLLDIANPGTAGETATAFSQELGTAFASASKLLELSRGLAVRVNSRVVNATNLATGEAQMVFETQHNDETGAPLKVPSAFLLAIPVFKLGALYQVPVRLRYRVRDAKVVWFYELYRIDRIFDHAFKEACDAARVQTELPLFIGSPEA